MIVKRSALLIAGLLCFGFSGPDTPKLGKHQVKPAQGGADWLPANIDPSKIASLTERSFRTFKSVAGGVRLNYRVPYSGDPSGYGNGFLLMNEYFWSPTKFRIEYMDSGVDQKPYQVPSSEFVAVNGLKKARLGQFVGPKMVNFSNKQRVFDVASDADLVEKWPTRFSKYLFSPFVGGNATLSRYVNALKKGIGGYGVKTEMRYVTVPTGSPLTPTRRAPQYRIRAERKAKGKVPASTVEMIFAGEAPYLPVTINTTYGPIYKFNWSNQWYNKANLKDIDPFKIGPTIKK
jgi:hypothetical protein